MLSLIGLLAALALLILLTVRGMNLFIATPLCALLIALSSGIALLPALAADGHTNLLDAYMGGFSDFIGKWFFMFLLGSIFGKLMEASGAAESIARWVLASIGGKRAALAVVIACAVLTYGGVSLFVVAFSVYPIALSLFRAADLPRRFIPAEQRGSPTNSAGRTFGFSGVRALFGAGYSGPWEASIPEHGKPLFRAM